MLDVLTCTTILVKPALMHIPDAPVCLFGHHSIPGANAGAKTVNDHVTGQREQLCVANSGLTNIRANKASHLVCVEYIMQDKSTMANTWPMLPCWAEFGRHERNISPHGPEPVGLHPSANIHSTEVGSQIMGRKAATSHLSYGERQSDSMTVILRTVHKRPRRRRDNDNRQL